jgi:transposase
MDTLEIPLEIPDVKIEKIERTKEGDFVITVTSIIEGAICHKCGRYITKSYGYDKEIIIRHLPILGHKTFIHIHPKRYECPYCEGKATTTQKMTWYDQRSPNTNAYERHVLPELINSTVADASIKEDIGYEAVMGIINRHIDSEVNWDDIKRLDTIGIDEISLKKGHKDFVTLITGGEGRRISGVLQGREKATVKAFLSGIPERLKQTLEAVCCDMYDGYINAVWEIFGKKVMVVADRFHVAKLYRKDSDGLRKQEMKRLKKKLSENEYGKLKGAMWALRKNEADLTLEEREVLRILFKHSRILKIAYELCNELTGIFNQNITKEDAQRKIMVWMEVVGLFGLDCSDGFLSTLNNRMDEITNYFVNRQSSGFVEGLNNKIKVIKRRCYGIFNIKHLFQRIFLDLEGYALFA